MLSRSKVFSGVVRAGQLFAATSLLTYCSGSDRNFQEAEHGGSAGAGKSNSGGSLGRGGDKGAGGSSKGGQSSTASGGEENPGGASANGGNPSAGGESPMGGAGSALGGATALGGQTAAGGSASGGAAMGGTSSTASGGAAPASGGTASGGNGSGGTTPGSGGKPAGSGGNGSGGAGCTSRCNETGTACTTSNQCKSGWCVDGLCCESACSGQCEACASALTGAADGFCAPSKRGTDPDNECATAAASTCGQTGMCNGSRACALYDTSTVCAAATCSGGTAKSSQMCDGAGVCKPAATSTSCAPYICGTNACLTACTKNTDCSSGNVCVAAKCQAPSPLLGTCDETADCARGECISGACGLYIKTIRITGTAVAGGGDPHSSLDGWFKSDANGRNLVRVSSIPQGMRLWDSIDLQQVLTSPLPPNNYLLLTDAESSNALTRNFQFTLSDGTSITKVVQAGDSSEIVLLEGTGDPFMLFQWTGADVKVIAKVY